jgi:hypothetical protein
MDKKIYLGVSMLIFNAMLLAACAKAESSMGANDEGDELVEESIAVASIEVENEGTGFCANAFFPISSRNTWKYSASVRDKSDEYTVSFKDITDSSFASMESTIDSDNEVNWICTDKGLVSSTYFNLLSNHSNNVVSEVTDISGVTLPTEDEWVEGLTWDLNYQINVVIHRDANREGTPPPNGEVQPPEGEDILPAQEEEPFLEDGEDIQTEGEITITRKIAKIERITVTAGTFEDAYRVDSSGVMTVTIRDTQTSMPLLYSDWYVKGVGVVKSSSSDANAPFSLELVAVQ